MHNFEKSKRYNTIKKPYGQRTDGGTQPSEFLRKYFGNDKPPQRTNADSEKSHIEKDQCDGQPFTRIA